MRIFGYIAAAFIAAFTLTTGTAQAAWKDANCQPGEYLIGFHANTGVWVDRLGPICGRWDSTLGHIDGKLYRPMLGTSTGGSPRPDALCPRDYAVSKVVYNLPVNNGIEVLENVVVACKNLLAPHDLSKKNPPSVWTAGRGADDNHTFSFNIFVCPGYACAPFKAVLDTACEPGQIATGFRADADRFVGDIALTCVPGWPSKLSIDGNTPTPQVPELPKVPIDIGAGASFLLGPQGGGAQINVDCRAGEALVGIATQGKSYIDSIGARCRPFSNGVASGVPFIRGTLGSGSGPLTLADCPSGAVAAADGDTSSYQNLIARVSLRCSSGASSSATGANSPNGVERWTHGVVTCGPGKVAVGLYGWKNADGTLKSFGLRCKPASVFASSGSGTPAPGGLGGTATASDFYGVWVMSLTDGYTYEMALSSIAGGGIGGFYDVGRRNGAITNASVSGGVLSFQWQQTGTIKGNGTGNFHLDDANHISGTWTFGAYSGTWKGFRK